MFRINLNSRSVRNTLNMFRKRKLQKYDNDPIDQYYKQQFRNSVLYKDHDIYFPNPRKFKTEVGKYKSQIFRIKEDEKGDP